MDLTKAAIHTLDADLKTMILSEVPLNTNATPSLETYVLKFVKALHSSTNASKIKLGENSSFNSILNEQFNFIEVTQKLSQQWFDRYIKAMDYRAVSLVFAQVDADDTTFLTMFELHNKNGFIKITQNQHGIENTLVEHQAIFPNTFASVQAAYMLDLQSGAVLVKSDNAYRDTFEALFDGEIVANSKESFKVVDTLVSYISEKREEDPVLNTIKAKQVLTDNVELYDEIEPKQVLKDVFAELTDDEEMVVEQTFASNNVTDFINLKTIHRTSVAKRHRIKTESGVEILLPLDILDISDIVDITTDTQGKVSISLHNLGKIVE